MILETLFKDLGEPKIELNATFDKLYQFDSMEDWKHSLQLKGAESFLRVTAFIGLLMVIVGAAFLA